MNEAISRATGSLHPGTTGTCDNEGRGMGYSGESLHRQKENDKKADDLSQRTGTE